MFIGFVRSFGGPILVINGDNYLNLALSLPKEISRRLPYFEPDPSTKCGYASVAVNVLAFPIGGSILAGNFLKYNCVADSIKLTPSRPLSPHEIDQKMDRRDFPVVHHHQPSNSQRGRHKIPIKAWNRESVLPVNKYQVSRADIQRREHPLRGSYDKIDLRSGDSSRFTVIFDSVNLILIWRYRCVFNPTSGEYYGRVSAARLNCPRALGDSFG